MAHTYLIFQCSIYTESFVIFSARVVPISLRHISRAQVHQRFRRPLVVTQVFIKGQRVVEEVDTGVEIFLLDISQPAISLYQAKLRGTSLNLESDPDITALVTKHADYLVKGTVTQEENLF